MQGFCQDLVGEDYAKEPVRNGPSRPGREAEKERLVLLFLSLSLAHCLISSIKAEVIIALILSTLTLQLLRIQSTLTLAKYRVALSFQACTFSL